MSDVNLFIIEKAEDLQSILDLFHPQYPWDSKPHSEGYRHVLALDTETSPHEPVIKRDTEGNYLTERREGNDTYENVYVYDEDENRKRGLDPHRNKIRTVQISDGLVTVIVIMDGMDPTALQVLQPMFNDTLVLGCNLSFDVKMLTHHCGLSLPFVWDLNLAELCLTAGLYKSLSEWYRGASLSTLAKKYLDQDISKEIRSSFATGELLTYEQLLYAQKDTEVLPFIYNKQRPIVEEEGLLQTVQIECGAIAGIAEMELQGMYLDREKWLALAHTAEQRRREIYDELQLKFIPKFYLNYFGEERARSLGLKIVDPNSIPDTKRAFAEIGVVLPDCQEKTFVAEVARLTGELDVEGANKEEVAYQLRCLDLQLDYKEVLKQSTSFGEAYLRDNLNPVTGRIHTNFNLVVTGRYSSSSPNLQQLPARGENAIKYREAFSVPEDSELVIIAADWANAESRIMGWFSQEPVLLEAFNGTPAKDPHALTACWIFGYDYDTFMERLQGGDKEYKQIRSNVKNTAFCKAYGGGPAKVAYTAGCSFQEAEKFMDLWEKSMPRLKRWLEDQGRLGMKNMQIRGIAGWRRFFTRPNPNEITSWEYRKEMGSIDRAARNTPVQNPNAVWMKQVLHELPPLIHPMGFRLCNMVHDEIDSVGHEWYATEVAKIMKAKMIEVGERWLCEKDGRKAVKVEAEYHIERWWAK